MSDKTYDLLVLGAGPGGYVAAIRAAQLGLKTAIVDANAALGGTCLRIGCIPSKALLDSSHRYHSAQHELIDHGVHVAGVGLDLEKMMQRKDKVVKALTGGVKSLMKKNEVDVTHGRGVLRGPGEVEVTGDEGEKTTLEAEKIVLATGSVPSTLPGVELDGDRVGSSTEALAYPEVPERLVVIGAGYIGLELGSVWARLGSQVTVLEYLDRILPGMDLEIAKAAQKIFQKQGLELRLGTKVTGVERDGDLCRVQSEGNDPIECDRVLVAVGRKPASQEIGLEEVGVETDERGFVQVDEHYATNVPGVYAIGDLIGGALLAHKAEEEGIACVESIVTGYGHVHYDAIPGVVYTEPEIASVGRTQEQLEEDGVPFKKGTFPYRGNGRARAMGAEEGLVKVLAHQETDRILGVHILGAHAGDLIAEAVAAIEFGATAEDLARTSHAHPTLAEIVKEACLAATEDRAIHI
ncbi:MAG: dihydrolipoyl dehydrogenase [Acidobacteria bacterium]|nr:MAG: dihydrolipoyl dehydrogenase [Acidobacteriota bacterium]REK00904.1 MAG: dihydrolipoyl dehydrogenase [Acidobacteriota bacterium]